MKAAPRRKPQSSSEVRLQRVMADAGVAARRACETLIEGGHVSVNGETRNKLPVFVNPHTDRIEVDGRLLPRPERKLYLMVYKPPRMLVTNADEPELDRATIMEIVDHPAGARLFPVGRLDFETGGLVLMTNDGDLTNSLTHPKFRVPRVYEAVIKGALDQAALDAVSAKIRGVRKRASREEGSEGPVAIGSVPVFEVIRVQMGNTIVRVTLIEAQNRELRETLAFLGMPVKKLTRVAMGGLELSGVAPAQWRELTRDELHTLRRPRGGYIERKFDSGTKIRTRHRSTVGTHGSNLDGRPVPKVRIETQEVESAPQPTRKPTAHEEYESILRGDDDNKIRPAPGAKASVRGGASSEDESDEARPLRSVRPARPSRGGQRDGPPPASNSDRRPGGNLHRDVARGGRPEQRGNQRPDRPLNRGHDQSPSSKPARRPDGRPNRGIARGSDVIFDARASRGEPDRAGRKRADPSSREASDRSKYPIGSFRPGERAAAGQQREKPRPDGAKPVGRRAGVPRSEGSRPERPTSTSQRPIVRRPSGQGPSGLRSGVPRPEGPRSGAPRSGGAQSNRQSSGGARAGKPAPAARGPRVPSAPFESRSRYAPVERDPEATANVAPPRNAREMRAGRAQRGGKRAQS